MIKISKKLLEPGSIEMRKMYSNTIEKLMDTNPSVIALEADLANAITMDRLCREKPCRAINCGIMEANMIGVAAGLSIAGKVPFVHTFNAFASRRVYDQLFMSIAYQKNNVKVLASDSGITATHNGGTHMCFEDMGIVRGLAGAVVMEATDAVMLENLLNQIASLKGFHWLRTVRKNVPFIYDEGSDFTIGKGIEIREGSDITLIANGIMVAESLKAAEALAKEGINAAVIDMFTLKPFDKDIVKKYIRKTGRIVTCENHSIYNGLGSAAAEVIAEEGSGKLARIGVNEEFGQVGTQDYLMKYYKLTAEDICAAAKKLL